MCPVHGQRYIHTPQCVPVDEFDTLFMCTVFVPVLGETFQSWAKIMFQASEGRSIGREDGIPMEQHIANIGKALPLEREAMLLMGSDYFSLIFTLKRFHRKH